MIQGRNLKRESRGQSHIEYFLLIVMVLVLLVIFAGPGGIFTSRLNTTEVTAIQAMSDKVDQIANGLFSINKE